MKSDRFSKRQAKQLSDKNISVSEYQLEEIVRCGKDPIYFMKNYVKITHPQGGIIQFDTFPFQDACVGDFLKHRFNIVLKSRQLGLSTVTAAYCLWLALFRPAKNILVIATKFEVAKEFLKKVILSYESLPPWLVLPKERSRNVKTIEFTNESRITAVPTSDNAARGSSLSLLVVDEAAHIHNLEELWSGLYSTTQAGGSIILLSTPLGIGNLFHQTWIGCDLERKSNTFHGIKLPWTVHPEHDEEWFRTETMNITPKQIAQEYLCDFLGSGNSYFHEMSMGYIHSMISEPLMKLNQDQNTWIWRTPVIGHKYIISADIARGDADDFSTACVIDVDESELVAEFQGKIPPDRFAELLIDLGQKYLTALICPEKNTFGILVGYKLKELKYPNLYYEKYAKNGIFQSYNADDIKNEYPGITITAANRQGILAKLEESIRNQKLKLYSSRFVEEAKTFVWNSHIAGGKAQAMKGYNDDLIMALAMGCYLFESNANKENTDEINKAMFAAWGRNSVHLNGAGTYNSADPLAFQKSNIGVMNTPNSASWFHQEAKTDNIPFGVKLQQLRQFGSMYNAYGWLFNDHELKKRK